MIAEAKQKKVADYHGVFDETNYEKRSGDAQKVTNNYYDLVTNFYESGWGESFHFASRFIGEDFKASIIRHEHFLAIKLGLSHNDKVLDVGCGVMGPARNLARISGAHITGLTINHHQVARSKTLNGASSVDHLLNAQQGDFMDMPFPDNSFDKMYAIEALCHAPNFAGVYSQILRKLKPGGKACFYQWALTSNYDSSNPEHVKARELIEYGNSITELKTTADIDREIEQAGFVKEEVVDLLHTDYGNDLPWFSTLQSGWSLSKIRHTKVSRTIVQFMLRRLESIGLVKKGVSKTHRILLAAADGLVAGGELEIFTPMYLVVVSKSASSI